MSIKSITVSNCARGSPTGYPKTTSSTLSNYLMIKTKNMNTVKKIITLFIVLNIFINTNGQTNLQTVTNVGNTTTFPITVHSSIYLGKGSSTGTNNLAIGAALNAAGSTATENLGIGLNNLSSLTTGSINVSMGNSSLQQLVSGTGNCSFGPSSMRGQAAFSTVTYNSAFGSSALEYVTNNATNNCAFGNQALKGILSGKFNVGMGGIAGFNLTGDSNVVVGFSSGFTVTGNSNVVIGTGAGAGAMPGSRNVILGYNANINNLTLSNQLSIQNVIYGINMTGVGVPGTGNIGISVIPSATTGGTLGAGVFSKLHIGGNSGTTMPSLQLDYVPTSATIPVVNPGGVTGKYLFIDAGGVVSQASLPAAVTNCGAVNFIPVTNNVNGNMGCSQIFDNGVSVGIATVGPFTYTSFFGLTGPNAPPPSGTFKLSVNGVLSGLAYYATSDERYKKDIKSLSGNLDKIKQLRGVSYYWKDKEFPDKNFNTLPQLGFIAQELGKIIPEAVAKNKDGYYMVNYSTLIPVLTEGIKEQQSQIENQQIKIEDLQSQITDLKNRLNQLTPGEVKIKADNFEITPNPITGISTVSYKLDNANATSYLAIYDLQGRLLKQIGLAKNVNEGQVQIRKTDFGNGMYILSLISNNSEVQSKRFIISQ